jgi:hypothetical protein
MRLKPYVKAGAARLRKRPWLKSGIGVGLGAVLGWAYYQFIGCRTGTCLITGDPVNSAIYGAVLGLIWALPMGNKEK